MRNLSFPISSTHACSEGRGLCLSFAVLVWSLSPQSAGLGDTKKVWPSHNWGHHLLPMAPGLHGLLQVLRSGKNKNDRNGWEWTSRFFWYESYFDRKKVWQPCDSRSLRTSLALPGTQRRHCLINCTRSTLNQDKGYSSINELVHCNERKHARTFDISGQYHYLSFNEDSCYI